MYKCIPAFQVRACLLINNHYCLEKIVKNQIDWGDEMFTNQITNCFPKMEPEDPKLKLPKFIDLASIFESQETDRQSLIDLMLL